MSVREFFRKRRERRAEKRFERNKARREILANDPRAAERLANQSNVGGGSDIPNL